MFDSEEPNPFWLMCGVVGMLGFLVIGIAGLKWLFEWLGPN